MEPNFLDGELMLIDRISYYFASPTRGDSVVFVFPGTNNDKYIKRIIGLPGEEVTIKDGQIRINGKRLKEDYIPNYIKTSGDVSYKLKRGQYLVLGDNRELSNDSRIWGPLNREDIIGKAQAIIYPLNQKRYIERRSYNI